MQVSVSQHLEYDTSEEEGVDGAGAGAVPYPITETVRAYLRADRAWPYVGKPPKVNCKTWPVATGLTLTTHQASRQPSSGKCVLYSMHVGARHGSQAGSQATALTGGVRRFGWVHDGSCRWFLPRALIGSFLPPRQGLRRESCSPTRRRGCPVRHHTTSQQADASTTIFSLPLPARPTRYNRAGTPAAPGARWCPLRAAKSLFDSVHAATGHGPRWHRTGGGGQFDRIGRIMGPRAARRGDFPVASIVLAGGEINKPPTC